MIGLRVFAVAESDLETSTTNLTCPNLIVDQDATSVANPQTLIDNGLAVYRCACRVIKGMGETGLYCAAEQRNAENRCSCLFSFLPCLDRLDNCLCELGDLFGLGGSCGQSGRMTWQQCQSTASSNVSSFITVRDRACESIKSVDSTNRLVTPCDCSGAYTDTLDTGSLTGGNPFGLPLPAPGNNGGTGDLNLPPPTNPTNTSLIPPPTSTSGTSTGTVSGATTAGNGNATGVTTPGGGSTTASGSGSSTAGSAGSSSLSGSTAGFSNAAKSATSAASASGGTSAANSAGLSNSQSTLGAIGADGIGVNGRGAGGIGATSGGADGAEGYGVDGSYNSPNGEKTSPFRVVDGERIGVSRGDTLFKQINNGYDRSIPRARFNLR